MSTTLLRAALFAAMAATSGCGASPSELPGPSTGPSTGPSASPSEGESSRTAQDAAPADLAALGYAAWDRPPTAPPCGALVHDAGRVAPGWNLRADDVDRVLAFDADGHVRREWRVPRRTQVEYAKLLPGGRLLALSVDEGLTLLEHDGEVVWHADLPCHHDVAVRPGDPPGARTFAVATHTERVYVERRVRFDEVRCVDEATGAILAAPVLDSFALRVAWLAPYAAGGGLHALDVAPGAPTDTVYDYFHLNSLEWERDGEHGESLLLCLRNVDTVASVAFPFGGPGSRAFGELLWHAGPDVLDAPHMPRRLAPRTGEPRGDVLVFDNGRRRGWSRTVTFGQAGEVREQWSATPRSAFSSDVRGGVQRLANGNTLLTESERGRAFEVAPDGALVWEYWNPERRRGAVRRIYRVERYPEAWFAP